MQNEPVALYWAKVKNGEIVRCETILPKFDEDFAPDAAQAILTAAEDAAPITEDNAVEHGWYAIEGADVPSFDATTQAIDLRPTVTLVEGVPTADWGLRTLSQEECDAANAAFNEAQRLFRQRAFSTECDPLSGKLARGEDGVTVDDLTVKAAEIRARYPYRS